MTGYCVSEDHFNCPDHNMELHFPIDDDEYFVCSECPYSEIRESNG